MKDAFLDERPIVVAVAGSNGAGKTTFYHAHLAASGLRFVNADDLARALDLEPYEAARAADAIRRSLLARRESFVFETVLWDPVGEKVGSLREAATAGFTVVLCFIGIDDVATSHARVAMRVSQGGHDVPAHELDARFRRTLANLERAIRGLPHVVVFDNSDLRTPYRRVATFAHGVLTERVPDLPDWLPGPAR